MANTILVGNGPNRLGSSPVAWGEVLRQITPEGYRSQGDVDPRDKPFPLLFEEFALGIDRNGKDGVAQLKQRFAAAVNRLEPNAIHRQIMQSGPANVITTNYDYALELAEDGTMPERADPSTSIGESKYSIFRHRIVGPTRVWHVHGEVAHPNTLQLGYEHYGSSIGQIKQYVTRGIRKHVSPYSEEGKGLRQTSPAQSWVDVFLRDDVHIVGLALEYVEIDLWWLLVLKGRLRERKRKTVGRTLFYWAEDPEASPEVFVHLDMMRGVGVEVLPVAGLVGGGYEMVYAKTLALIG